MAYRIMPKIEMNKSNQSWSFLLLALRLCTTKTGWEANLICTNNKCRTLYIHCTVYAIFGYVPYFLYTGRGYVPVYCIEYMVSVHATCLRGVAASESISRTDHLKSWVIVFRIKVELAVLQYGDPLTTLHSKATSENQQSQEKQQQEQMLWWRKCRVIRSH